VADETTGEYFLLALLNTTPREEGTPTDQLADPDLARAWLLRQGGTGSTGEQRQVRAARDALQSVVRAQQPPEVLAPFLAGASSVPALAGDRVTWTLTADPDRLLAVRAVLAWDELERLAPGRLRPCANQACRLFLIDRTKGNTARWCSMAVCGNRMKARRHYQRARTAS
jgi:predicted RNA-binding Zn ribbon-like protein